MRALSYSILSCFIPADVQHICTPTRSQLLSSRYQTHTGLQHGIIADQTRQCLPPKFKTIGDAFTTMGYGTHMIGVSTLGSPFTGLLHIGWTCYSCAALVLLGGAT